jgi:hypothetical protein
MNTIITKYKTSISERKDIENALAENDKRNAILDYIVACDYPEVFEDNEEGFEV